MRCPKGSSKGDGLVTLMGTRHRTAGGQPIRPMPQIKRTDACCAEGFAPAWTSVSSHGLRAVRPGISTEITLSLSSSHRLCRSRTGAKDVRLRCLTSACCGGRVSLRPRRSYSAVNVCSVASALQDCDSTNWHIAPRVALSRVCRVHLPGRAHQPFAGLQQTEVIGQVVNSGLVATATCAQILIADFARSGGRREVRFQTASGVAGSVRNCCGWVKP